MYIKARVWKKPVSNGVTTTYEQETKKLKVSRIKNTESRKNAKPCYYAMLTNPVADAPFNDKTNGVCWVNFLKSENKELKIPVLKPGEELAV